ncbi:MAG: hypothetical protein KME52_26875 [Desmonostoc geniculatum HA4340-LM1]|nr:hypothetical protein [Desmonostoc geniculatum HA4340-LM1]
MPTPFDSTKNLNCSNLSMQLLMWMQTKLKDIAAIAPQSKLRKIFPTATC